MIIGCGGGFRHETSQKYSPILEWMDKVQLCLHDEAQQFGNLDEVAALARLPPEFGETRTVSPVVPEALLFCQLWHKPGVAF